MKFYSCQIWGDMSSDRASEQYPTVNVCEDCYKLYSGEEDSPIITTESTELCYGDECHFCHEDLED